MTEVKQQKGIVREEQQHDDRVSEWEEGLPSLADLISLSQCLISPQLASAFSIPSRSPSSSTADVVLASHAHADLLVSPDALQANPFPQPHAGDTACLVVKDPHLNAADGVDAIDVNPHVQGDRSLHVTNASERIHNSHAAPDERYCNSQPANAVHLRRYSEDTSVGEDHGISASLNGRAGVFLKALERDEDGVGEGEGHVHSNAVPCISDSSDVATQADADGEAEETESAPSPAENPNEETTARTLKRPRLVWTPELHKRFVDAVSHLGVKTAVPKTIMQLMNVEGLTRENVASHLQKYRLYLKRMQGLSNEGPMPSDHLFASTPVPANLAAAGRFHTGMPAHLQDISQVPFVPSHNPVSMGRGHVGGIMSGPLPSMDPYSFNIFARPPSNRFVRGDLQDVQAFRQHHSPLSEHILKK